MQRRLNTATDPAEWIIHDAPTPCVYLPSRSARLPMRLPTRPLTADAFAQRLREGDRRQGPLLYRPHCPGCRACEAIRIDVGAFAPGRTQRRVFRRGEATFRIEIGRPCLSTEKLSLYRRHKLGRGLLVSEEPLGPESYTQFLVETCTDSLEIRYRIGNELIAVAIVDRAEDALSAVYCYFDPAYGRLSPGAYSILKQIALCREWGLPYLYLGLYVAGCRPMEYKAGYLPHERLVDGRWRRFERTPTTV